MRTGIYPPEQRFINLDSDWVYRAPPRGRRLPRALEHLR
jgi:hypothetical protein